MISWSLTLSKTDDNNNPSQCPVQLKMSTQEFVLGNSGQSQKGLEQAVTKPCSHKSPTGNKNSDAQLELKVV